MSVKICAIASWSNGNCYYIGTEKSWILIDNGISYKMLTTRMKERGLSLEKIKGIFISHEHTDHIRGLPRFCKFHPEIPIYFNAEAFTMLWTEGEEYYTQVEDLFTDEIMLDEFKIIPFFKSHDTVYPLSFRVEVEGISIGVFTDIGEVDEILQKEFSQCQAVFIETNYDEQMLRYGPYPAYLKNRVSKTHLSNTETFELIKKYANHQLKILIFSHISKDNNSYQKILERFSELSQYQISLAKREECGELFEL